MAGHTADSARTEPKNWDGLSAWLVEGFSTLPTAAILDLFVDLAPSGQSPAAQVQIFENGALLLRQSSACLTHLLFASYAADHVTHDVWQHDTRFPDCTDGYLISTDAQLVADACVAWFRDRHGVDVADEVQFDYRLPDDLPFMAPTN
ncbi:hypothetical protein [Williamsia sterculiae]|uniref:Uncharacterized protein n=1 Tax=Williamsia sterculiae TaxID=1344003 RepID=A0A1N7DGJ0_9NOCA|nr:hypothetical protein [Williamsia sterculiae]SIR74900.1 hypothetical protein SAMN05445060_0615 [Williamsia sterculiae]